LSTADSVSLRALVLAPNGRDAPLTVLLLKAADVSAHVCADLPALTSEMQRGAGMLIIAEEAVRPDRLQPVLDFLGAQPAWSDLPVILLTHRGGGPERNPAAVRLGELLGNVSFLERPFHPVTLHSMVRAAARARRRQYDARQRLEERERLIAELAVERGALSDLTRTLEQRVAERSAELMREVAARERAQEQLLQSQKMESVGKLTGGIAHDFNNLLMAVLSNLELLRKRLPDEPGVRRLIDGAMQGAQRGASLTQRMLAFARQQDLKTIAADLAGLVCGMRELLNRSLGPQIALRLHIEPGLPPAEVDAQQVELAVLNLAINARDAMPDGGAIDVIVDQARSQGDAHLRPGNYLRIRIRDQGCGMDPVTLNRAVEPFFSTKPLGKGTGLGLSMTHGLAVQLGGHLDLSSAPGAGTVATLWLPMATRPSVEPVAPAAPAPAPTPTPTVGVNRVARILVVDDDPLIAMSTADMLEDLGYAVIEADSGKRALEIIAGGQAIDLMMTDQAMPGMTGIQLAELVRSTRPELPVLLATGYTDLPAGKAANLPRLSKPYQQAQLQAEIEKLLDAH
jgi:signal transduction histidine kinase